jgi:hypothetical protein
MMMRSLLSLAGPSTLIISLITISNASLDVVYDYIDAHGLPADINEYSWGGYAKKRNTAVPATAVPATHHHPRVKHAQLLSRQVVVHHPFQSPVLLLANTPFSLSVQHSRQHVLRTEGVVQIQKFVSTSARLLVPWCLLLTPPLQAASASLLKVTAATLAKFASERRPVATRTK